MELRTAIFGMALLLAAVLSAQGQGAKPARDGPAGDSSKQAADPWVLPPGVSDWRQLTDAEWRTRLTRDQYLVTRAKATEPAWSGRYAAGHRKGTFACVCCGAALFGSQHKFNSGTGWPSFWRPIDPARLETAPDFSNPAEARVEVTCARCGAHLGHVFQDGPPPTGLRFCINSASLRLLSPAPANRKPPAKPPDPEASRPNTGTAKPQDG